MARRATKLDEDANFGSPARNRAREQASMGRNPSEQKKIIAAQSPSSALNPDRQGGDSDPHHITIPVSFSTERVHNKSDRQASRDRQGAEPRASDKPTNRLCLQGSGFRPFSSTSLGCVALARVGAACRHAGDHSECPVLIRCVPERTREAYENEGQLINGNGVTPGGGKLRRN